MAEVQTAEKGRLEGLEPSVPEKRSLAEIMWLRAEERSGRDFLHVREGSGWRSITWDRFAGDVSDVARALIAYGIEPGDRVAILSNTRYEWTVCDYALLSVGAIVVPIYQTSSEEEVEYILNDSGTRLVFLEDSDQVEKIKAVKPKLGGVERFVRIDGSPVSEDGFETLEAFRQRGGDVSEDEVRKRTEKVDPDDVCTYIYTSGTTGPPKGCMITHWNFASCMSSVLQRITDLFNERETTLLFLPLAHGFARMTQFVCVDTGMQIYYGNVKELSDELKSSRPSFFISVPRMFEKAYAGVQSKASSSLIGKAVFRLSTGVAEPVSKSRQKGGGVPMLLKIPYLIADKLVYSKVRAALGGNVRYAISGGAPLAVHVAHFFNAAGITILEGYGLTETAPASTVNTPGEYRLGTVGKSLPVNEIKIADDGEVLMRGDNIFRGYYRNEEKTREALEDGWFHSGDIGEFDGDGYLKITGRKKDLIITAGGKNVAPVLIEDKLKQSQYISQAVVIGDKRPYLVALLTLDGEEAKGKDAEEMKHLVEQHVEAVNKGFGRVEQVKKHRVLDRDFSIEDGEITPTLKVKRANIQKRYADEIEQLYNS